MTAKTIKSALGLLQDDPDNGHAWQELRNELAGDPGMSAAELGKLLEAARRAHEGRREHEAVARLLEIEAGLAGEGRDADLLSELARVLDEELLDDERGMEAYARLLAVRPDDRHAAQAMAQGSAKRAKWRELVDRYLSEAKGTADPAFHSSLLVSAAEVTYRYGAEGGTRDVDGIVSLVREGLALDPKNRRG